MFRGMPFGCLAIYAARTTATRAVAQLMEAMEMRVEQAGKQVEGAWWTADASRRQRSWGCGKEGERGSSCG
jgi:hypothetical protein